MKVLCANEIPSSAHKQISEIFTDGFYQWLKYFSKDKKKLSFAFEHMFNLDVFYVAVIDDVIVGMSAINDGSLSTVKLSKKVLQQHLGFIRGLITYVILKHQFEDKKYPFEIESKMGSVEFVATAQSHRGKGVATEILKTILALPNYTAYVLEVADTNTKAVSVYEKLGFKEFMRIDMKNKNQSGVNDLIYMKCLK